MRYDRQSRNSEAGLLQYTNIAFHKCCSNVECFEMTVVVDEALNSTV